MEKELTKNTILPQDAFIAYHQVERNKLPSVKANGILRSQTSDNDTEDIKKANEFINRYRLQNHISAGLSRSDVIYGYLAHGDKACDVETGKLVRPHKLVNDQKVLIAVKIQPDKCWVSSLDLYDEAKESFWQGDMQRAAEMSRKYWTAVAEYSDFKWGDIDRPELLIPYDISQKDIIGVFN